MKTILSLFDGISCGYEALTMAGFKGFTYYASEIDKYAIKVSEKNHPDIIHIGDVREVKGENLPAIDLLIGGSPCQDLSIAKANRQGLDGERSGLFWEYVRILKETNPKYFILENVASMPKEAKRIISEALGVESIMINAALVSAQNRKRLFWTNIKGVKQPEDRNIFLKDILQKDVDEIYFCKTNYLNWLNSKSGESRAKKGFIKINGEKSLTLKARDYVNWSGQLIKICDYNNGGQSNRIYSPEGKSVFLSANGGGCGAKTGLYEVEGSVRKLTPIECERLQCLPDKYTEGISNTQRYKCLGNAFNVAVVAHILSFIKGELL